MTTASGKPRLRFGMLLLVLLVGAGGFAAVNWLRDRGEGVPVRRIQPAGKTIPAGFTRPPKPAPPAAGYVGSQACRQCHAELYAAYQTHPMSHSLTRAEDAAVVEDYKNREFKTAVGTRYSAKRTPNGVFHTESRIDSRGKQIYEQTVQVHYAVGSGRRGRTYLLDRGGLLYESPITWYSTRGVWDLSPGYLPGNHNRFERRIVDGCLACHAGRVATIDSAINRYRKRPFVESSIGCERCHGPGREHVERHRLGVDDGRPDPIVNPVKLDHRRQEAVCYQCHLHGEAKILRYGRTEFDFRPGDHLEKIWTFFVREHQVRDGKTRAVSQVEQMRSSVCFKKSRRMGCISCHDPHRSPAATERVAFYRSKCNQCHGKADVAECAAPAAERNKPAIANSCIKCHMPRFSASDVPHTAQTDHGIPRRPSARDVKPKQANAVTLFDEADQRIPAVEARRARGLFLAMTASDRENLLQAGQAVEMLNPVLTAIPDDVTVMFYLGLSFRVQRRDADARKVWEHALSLRPKDERVLKSLATLCHDAGDFENGVKYLDRFLKINPWESTAWGRHAHMLARLGKPRAGVASARKALELNPSMVNVHEWLAEVYGILQDPQSSNRHREIARRLKPPP